MAVRSPMSLIRPNGLGNSLTHTFNGHDYLRPDDGLASHATQCSGCHKGHMMQPELATEAQANLARLAVTSTSSEPRPFFAGAWRTNDVRLAELVVNGPPDVELPDTSPPAPTNLTTTEGVLSLRWDRAADPGLAGYKLYYGTEPGQYVGSVDVGDVSWFLARDLPQDGITYYVAARSYNVYGTESLTFSNEVSATAHAPAVTSIEPDHGPIGGSTPITITGQHFAPRGVRVTIGGQHAFNVQVVDDQTITAMTHWHRAGTVDVVVSNPDDLFGVLPGGFTYEKPEPPTDTDIRAPGG